MEFDEYKQMSDAEKYGYFSSEEGLFHVVTARQFTREILESLASEADRLRSAACEPEGIRELNTLLSRKRAMLFFSQPSTRTFLSFMNACHILGVHVSEVRDLSLTSSTKGESFDDTIRTFASYTDVIIMRHPEDDSAERAACVLDGHEKRIPLINAGSGKKEHPTQALLDVYTLMREFADSGGIDGKTILMAGDLKRGRTVRSLCCMLSEFTDVDILFAAVPEYQMKDDIRSFLAEKGIACRDINDFGDALGQADAVYMTRVQDEHDVDGESHSVDFSRFHLKKEHLDIMKKGAVIMHPLPRREEIPPEIDADTRAAYWRQEENGLWIRAALIANVLKGQ